MTEINTAKTTPETQEPTSYTQEDIDRIVNERVAQDAAKLEAAFAEKERELERKEMMKDAKSRLKKINMPEELLEALDTSSKKSLEKSLSLIEQYCDARIQGVPGWGGNPPEPFVDEKANIRKAMGLR